MVDDVPPWARDVPAGPPPRFPAEWQPAAPGGDDADAGVDVRAAAGHAAAGHFGLGPRVDGGERLIPGPGDQDITPADRRDARAPILLVLGAAAALLAVVGIVAAVGDDPDSAQSPPTSDLPTTAATSPDEGESATLDNTLAPLTPDDAPELAGDEPAAADLPTGGATVRVRGARPSVWESSTIDVLPGLDAITVPTEVVALTAGGVIHVIELPSGEVRSLDVGRSGRRVDLVLAEHGIVLDRFDVGNADLVTRSGDVIGFDVALGVASIRAQPMSDEFVIAASSGLDDRSARYVLDGGGGLLEISGTPIAEFDPETSWFAPDGDLVVTDAGGLYRLAIGETGDPPARISTGELIVAGPNHLLVRTCDPQRQCAHELLDLGTNVATEVQIGSAASIDRPPDVEWALAPDGSALAFIDAAGDDPIWTIVDLRSGDEIHVVRPGAPEVGAAWAADGSGIFTVERDRLVFYDRTIGGLLPVGDLDRVVAVAARPVAPDLPIAPEQTAPDGIRLVGLPAGGGFVRITLDTGVYQAVDAPKLDSNSPVYVVGDDEGVTVTSSATGGGFRLADDDAVVTMVPDGTSLAGPALPTSDGSGLWRPVDESWQAFELVDASGEPTGMLVSSDRGTGRGPDGAGGVLFVHDGGVDAGGPAGATPVTSGDVLAVGSGVAFVRECPLDRCATYRVDTVAGSRGRMVDRVVDEALTGAREATVAIGSSVSPDGTLAVLDTSDGWMILDTRAGTRTEIPPPEAFSPVIWSGDSRVAVFLAAQRLHVYDGLTGTVDLVGSVPTLRAVAAR